MCVFGPWQYHGFICFPQMFDAVDMANTPGHLLHIGVFHWEQMDVRINDFHATTSFCISSDIAFTLSQISILLQALYTAGVQARKQALAFQELPPSSLLACRPEVC